MFIEFVCMIYTFGYFINKSEIHYIIVRILYMGIVTVK